MDYILVHEETRLLICKECKFALTPSRINRHFTGEPHRLNPTIRRQIIDDISHIDYLVDDDQEVKSNIEKFLESFNNSSFIPQLALYEDGLACSKCSYISRSRRPI